MGHQEVEEKTINLYQARDLIGCTLRTVYNMMADGRLKKVENRWGTRVTLESAQQAKTLRKRV